MIRVYHYPGCSTCRRALRWLDDRGIAHRAIHIVEQPPSAGTLRRLWERSGMPLRKLFNTSGRAYRQGGWAARLGTLDDEEALAALAADGMLIKRPLVDAGDRVLVGFREADFEAALG